MIDINRNAVTITLALFAITYIFFIAVFIVLITASISINTMLFHVSLQLSGHLPGEPRSLDLNVEPPCSILSNKIFCIFPGWSRLLTDKLKPSLEESLHTLHISLEVKLGIGMIHTDH